MRCVHIDESSDCCHVVGVGQRALCSGQRSLEHGDGIRCAGQWWARHTRRRPYSRVRAQCAPRHDHWHCEWQQRAERGRRQGAPAAVRDAHRRSPRRTPSVAARDPHHRSQPVQATSLSTRHSTPCRGRPSSDKLLATLPPSWCRRARAPRPLVSQAERALRQGSGVTPGVRTPRRAATAQETPPAGARGGTAWQVSAIYDRG